MATVTDLQQFTYDQVAKKNGRNGEKVWIALKDQVYDVTTFINEHPGGGDLVLDVAGMDATRAFEEVGHSSDAYTVLKRLKIGQIVEAERKYSKKKEVKKVEVEGGSEQKKSFMSVVTCGLCG